MASPGQDPHIGSVKGGPTVGTVLYALLGLAAGLALLGDRLTFVPFAVQDAAPAIFGIFVVAFGVYRFAVVRAGRYPAAKAYFQVGGAVLLLVVLLLGGRHPVAVEAPAVDLRPLLEHADPAVRQLACEAARHRPGAAGLAAALAARQADTSPAVRAECAATQRALGL